MKKLLMTLTFFLAASMSLLQTGCVAIAAGGAAAGGTAYVMGKLADNLDAGIARAQAAVRESIDELGYTGIKADEDALEAEYVSKTALDDEVKIYLEKIDEGTTKITIRIGVFGDEQRSIQILNTIKGNL